MFNAGRTAKKGHSSRQHHFYFKHIHLHTQKHTKQTDISTFWIMQITHTKLKFFNSMLSKN